MKQVFIFRVTSKREPDCLEKENRLFLQMWLYTIERIPDWKSPNLPKQNNLWKGKYELVKEDKTLPGATELQSCFILTITNAEIPDQYFHGRLAILEHADTAKLCILNEAPTILKHSICLAIAG